MSTTTARLELRPERFFAEFGQQANAVEPGHLQVGDHDRRIPGENLFPGFKAVARSLGAITPAGDQLGQAHQRVGFVFGNQDFYGVLHRFLFRLRGQSAGLLTCQPADLFILCTCTGQFYAPEVEWPAFQPAFSVSSAQRA